jgi:hypothetical protein
VIILDHNVPRDQVAQLRRWHIRGVQIGFEVGRPEWLDQDEIVRYLQRHKRCTFFTRDVGFFGKRRCHRNHSIVIVTGPPLETAALIRRFLRHPRFATFAMRAGRVFKLTASTIAVCELGRPRALAIRWS